MPIDGINYGNGNGVREMGERKLLSMLLALALTAGVFPTAVSAAGSGGAPAGAVSVDAAEPARVNGSGFDVAYGDDLSVACSDRGVFLLGAGSYTASGAADSEKCIVIRGDASLTLDGAVLLHTTAAEEMYAPAISVESGRAQLILKGTNRVQGSPGYAGIYVAPGASLTISGEGSLEAKGGDGASAFGGGAGIGGNGYRLDGEDVENDTNVVFGEINISEGTIRATGGACNSWNVGGAAGIGGGGASTKPFNIASADGVINIHGGKVEAIGGTGDRTSETGGGSGIGSGGSAGGFYTQGSEVVRVNITDGDVTATGQGDGAGIGGGANVDGGEVTISGGTVTAVGGHETSGTYGGAGIGGGDNGGVTSIEISGGTVTATAGGAAAGIGGGNFAPVGTETEYGTITISEDAVVTAYGGHYLSVYSGMRGGAGIGSGRTCGFGRIAILDTATVRAYAGKSAQAIGTGTNCDEGEAPNQMEFSKTATVWMFNQDTVDAAFWGQKDDGTVDASCVTTNGADLVWYTETAQTGSGTASVSTKDSPLTWMNDSAAYRIRILNGTTTVAEGVYDQKYTVGNWAAVIPAEVVTLTYKLSEDDAEPTTQTCGVGEEIALADAPSKSGKVFTGWKCGERIYAARDKITPVENMTFIAQWKEASSENSGSSGGSASSHFVVSVDKTANGVVTASPKSASKGSVVTITVAPDEGYQLNRLTVTGRNGDDIAATATENGQYTFVMPAGKVTVTASFVEKRWDLAYRGCPKDDTCPIRPFADAKTTDWYHAGVHFCLDNGLMVGYADEAFRPYGDVTRGQIVTILWRLEGSPIVDREAYSDTRKDLFCYNAVRWAAANGVAMGYEDGSFAPNEAITREQFAAILWRYAKLKGYDVSVGEDTNILDYDDAFTVSSYAVAAIQWACGSGMINGTSAHELSPKDATSRAQAATMFMRYCAEIVK